MRKSPGWTRLAGIALELGALAFLAYVLMRRDAPSNDEPPVFHEVSKDAEPVEAPTVEGHPANPEPMTFLTDSADSDARYYRLTGEDVELLAGFYADGRVRLADTQNRRFAGMLQGSHADLLQLDTDQWSEVFLRVTPAGSMQLELRGGPYDARILTCEPLT